MPKKGRSGVPKEVIDGQQVQAQPRSRPSGTKKKPVNEIDQIFAGKKRKVQSQGTSDGTNQKGKKPVNEIDLIFAGKKRKKNQSQEKSDVANCSSESKKAKSSEEKGKGKKKKRMEDEEERRFVDRAGGSKSRRKTADGLTIYTEEELGLGQSEGGGGTGLCPFDCDCCY
ncbi:Uncharacterized protein C6G9.01c [Linum grandiflorum]